MMPEELLDVEDVARVLKLYRRDRVTLNTKAVYALPIRKTKIEGRVRYASADLDLYIALRAS